MAAVATAERGLIVYQLENQPSEFRRIESPLKHQVNNNICIYTDRWCSGLDIFCKKHAVFQNQVILARTVTWFAIDLHKDLKI